MRAPAIIAICLLFISCSHPKGLVFEDVRNVHINLIEPEPVSMDLKFYNPNYHHVTVRGAASYVYVNDQYIGRIELVDPVKARRRHSFYVPMKLNVDLIKEYPVLQKYAFDSSITLRLDGGDVTAGKKSACITTPISYDHRLPMKPPKMKPFNSKR